MRVCCFPKSINKLSYVFFVTVSYVFRQFLRATAVPAGTAESAY